jgi:hypothetical protein
MANFYYPSQPPVTGSSDAGLMGLGTLFNTGSAFPTEYIDFLKITAVSINYNKGAVLSNAGQSVGAAGAKGIEDKVKLGDSVFLYMPQNVASSYGVTYSNVAFGVTGKLAAEGLGKSGTAVVGEIQAAAGDATPEALFNTIAKGASDLGNTIGLAGGATGSQLSAAAQGKIFNPFEEMIFQGIGFRSHPFQWKMVARNRIEAQNINNIIKFFKVNMLPNYSDSSLTPENAAGQAAAAPATNAQAAGAVPFGNGSGARYLTVPNRFRIDIVRVNYNNNGFTSGGTLGNNIYKFKDCILESLNVSYTPDGQYVSTSDGLVPAVQIDCSFKETSYITAEDAANGY